MFVFCELSFASWNFLFFTWKFLPGHTAVFLILGKSNFRPFQEKNRFTGVCCLFLVHCNYEIREKSSQSLDPCIYRDCGYSQNLSSMDWMFFFSSFLYNMKYRTT